MAEATDGYTLNAQELRTASLAVCLASATVSLDESSSLLQQTRRRARLIDPDSSTSREQVDAAASDVAMWREVCQRNDALFKELEDRLLADQLTDDDSALLVVVLHSLFAFLKHASLRDDLASDPRNQELN